MEPLLRNSLQIEKHETIYGTFYCWAGDLITTQLTKYSAHTRNELAMVRSFIQNGDNILDIGAHIGTFSIPFSLFNGGKGRIFAFEANSDNYELLKKNILENGAENIVFPVKAVVSHEQADFSMKLPENGNSGMYYFSPVAHATDGRNSLSIRMDDWYSENIAGMPVDFIKIDVEGAELSVLRSCENIIRTYHPALYIEINAAALQRFGASCDEIDSLLKQSGYHFFRNTGERNSTNDNFTVAPLDALGQGGEFFDVIALHPSRTDRLIS